MKPKVTVIVATHQRPDFLFRCLLAIQKQNMNEFECLVVGDNCAYSKNVFNEFSSDDRFKYFETEIKTPNCGSVAKNVGLKNSVTDYICYCDDDNILLPNHLHDLYTEAIVNKKDIVFSTIKEIYFKDSLMFDILNRDIYYKNQDNVYESHLTHKDALSMIHAKKPALEIGGWKTMHELQSYNEDGYFMQALKDKVEHNYSIINNVTAIYYQHWAVNSDIKDDTTYKEQLLQLNENKVFVYPELIDKLKRKYLRSKI